MMRAVLLRSTRINGLAGTGLLRACLLLCLSGLVGHACAGRARAQIGAPQASRPVAGVHLGGSGNGSREVQQRTILGTVKDKAGRRLPGAMVYLRNVNRSTLVSVFADQQGDYRFGSCRLSDDYQVWAQAGDVKTPLKLVSSYIETPTVTVALEFPAGDASPAPSGSKAPQASSAAGVNQVPRPQ